MRDQLDILYFVSTEAPTVEEFALFRLLNIVAFLVLGRRELNQATEKKNRLLEHVSVILARLLIKLKPRVRLEAHETILVVATNKKDDVTVSFLCLAVQALLDHLRMINEANELPLAQVNHSLRHG